MIINGYAVPKGATMYSKAQQQWVTVVDPGAVIIQLSSGQKFTRTAEGAIMPGEPQDLFWTIEEAHPVQKRYLDGIQKGMTVFWITIPCEVLDVYISFIVIKSPLSNASISWKVNYEGKVGNEPIQTVFWAPLEYEIPSRRVQKTGYVNVYPQRTESQFPAVASSIYSTIESARKHRGVNGIDTVPITWTEPE